MFADDGPLFQNRRPSVQCYNERLIHKQIARATAVVSQPFDSVRIVVEPNIYVVGTRCRVARDVNFTAAFGANRALARQFCSLSAHFGCGRPNVVDRL